MLSVIGFYNCCIDRHKAGEIEHYEGCIDFLYQIRTLSGMEVNHSDFPLNLAKSVLFRPYSDFFIIPIF